MVSGRFAKLFAGRQVQCKLMGPEQLRREAEACFDKCQVLQVASSALGP